jgi:hypothetical protein
MVALGVWAGNSTPSCGTSDQCHQAGTFCAVGVVDRCDYCGDDPSLPDQTDPITGGTLNDARAADFAGYNLTAVSELCADPTVYLSLHTDGTARHGNWYPPTVSSVVSWCKSGNASLDLFIPGPLLAHDKY